MEAEKQKCGTPVRIYVEENDVITPFENHYVNLNLHSGEVIEQLEPRRLFPVNRPDEYITLLDTSGVERAIIRSLSNLSDESRSVIERSLEDYYLVPRITRVLKASEKSGSIEWTVETDRGIKRFYIHNRRDIRPYSDGTVRVRDSDDNRYVIDTKTLDFESKAKIITYI